MNKLLVVVDAQIDFITGALRNEDAIKAIPALVAYINQFDGDVIATKDTHYSKADAEAMHVPDLAYENTLEHVFPVHCIRNTEGWAIEPSVQAAIDAKEATIIEKLSFGYPDWADTLEDYSELDEIYLVGFCTDICVISNALILRALFPNAKMYIKADCCAGTTPENHAAALAVAASCQIEAI